MCASRPVYNVMPIKIWSKNSSHGHQRKTHLIALLSPPFQVLIQKQLEGALNALFSLNSGCFIYDKVAAIIAIWTSPSRDPESDLRKLEWFKIYESTEEMWHVLLQLLSFGGVFLILSSPLQVCNCKGKKPSFPYYQYYNVKFSQELTLEDKCWTYWPLSWCWAQRQMQLLVPSP